uniref:Peptidase S1 domain-containing protein n=1 Tax=Panagrolaimus davidi TaxID=227884 RepID=A0A914PMW8_9BILA
MIGNGAGNCTGSIIHEEYILTASHCIFGKGDHGLAGRPPSDFKVIVGSIKYGINGKIHLVEEVIKHAGYNALGDHDISLLKLKTPIIINEMAKPICLTEKFPITFQKVVAIGFGTTATPIHGNIPKDSESSKPEYEPSYSDKNYQIGTNGGICKFVEIPILKDEQCLHLPGTASVHFNPGDEICGGGLWKGTLEGDSGGPLVGLYKDGGYYQIGLTARGQPVTEKNGNPVDFGVYTKVSKYCKWISKETKNEVVCT